MYCTKTSSLSAGSLFFTVQPWYQRLKRTNVTKHQHVFCHLLPYSSVLVLFSKADICAMWLPMSQTPQKHAHNSIDAPPVTSTSACYLCCCVRSLDTMQVQVQTHMHAHIWSGFVPAVHLEAFFFTWYWWRSSASAEEPALSTSIGCIFQQTSAVARLPRLTFYVLVVLWWNWSEIYSHTACACVGSFYNVWSKNEG